MSDLNVSGTPGTVASVVIPDVNTEVSIPFRVDSKGDIAHTDDQTQIAIAHILGLAFTQPTERVMRPALGLGIQNMLFGNSAPATFEAVAATMLSSLSSIDGTFMVLSVTPVEIVGGWAFEVTFQLQQSPTTHTAVFDYQGNLVGVT